MGPIATELGVAYLSLSASTKDFAKDVKAALKDVEVDAEKTGKRSGASLGKGLKTGLKVGVTAVAALVATVGALALKGGISRALAIEDAQAKLKGLGHDTRSIQAIMDSALASVKGTAFGLGDAATVAASTVAAGIKPGEELTRTLKLVADASTIAGTSMADMGAIFNKVAGTGKIQGEVIAQLGERGIPILQLLADQLGVTAGEVAKMASAGKIDFETFQNAMEAGMGGAALKSGETFRGAMANAGAALGRLGEKVVMGVLPQIKDGFTGAIALMDSWGPAAEVVGERIGTALSNTITFIKDEAIPVLRDVADWLSSEAVTRAQVFATFLVDELVPAMREVVGWAKQNRTWLEPVTVALVAGAGAWKVVTVATKAWQAVAVGLPKILAGAKAGVIALNVALRANPIGLVITAITALVAGLVWFFTQTEVGRQVWETVWGAIQSVVQGVVDWWQNTAWPAISAVWTWISDAAMAFAGWFMEHVAPVFQAFGEFIQALADRVASIFRFMWNNVWKPILNALVELWNWVWGTMAALWERIGPPIMEAIGRWLSVVQGVWTTVWNVIKAVFEGVWNAIRTVVETALAVIKNVINVATAVIKGNWSEAWEAVKRVFTSIWEGMQRTVTNTVETIGNVIGTIKDTVLGVFSTVGTWLYEAGRDLMQGLVDGIKNMAAAPLNAAKEVGTGLVNGVKGVLGISSPSRVFRQIGQFTAEGMALGIADGQSHVRRSLMDMTSGLSAQLTVEARTPVPLGRGSADLAGATRGPVVEQHIHPTPGMSEEQVGAMAGRQIAWVLG